MQLNLEICGCLKNTTIGARQYPDKRKELTHWYFESDGSVVENIKGLPAELYC